MLRKVGCKGRGQAAGGVLHHDGRDIATSSNAMKGLAWERRGWWSEKGWALWNIGGVMRANEGFD